MFKFTWAMTATANMTATNFMFPDTIAMLRIENGG